MEKYLGVKFKHKKVNPGFSYDSRLAKLNQWAYLLSELGLAPVHTAGAYGNHSYRVDHSSFVITKSGMQPAEKLQTENFCRIVNFEELTTTFEFEGTAAPSSESFLHRELYQALPEVNAILHGHCSLFNIHASALQLPTTTEFCEYGTMELAESALKLVTQSTRFFILRDHGFVALGEDIARAGKLTLTYFARLIELLKAAS